MCKMTSKAKIKAEWKKRCERLLKVGQQIRKENKKIVISPSKIPDDNGLDGKYYLDH